jgi:hypothetical protein
VYANLACFKWEALRTIPPRLAITGFTYSQTFLITAAILYLETPSFLRNKNHAYGLIGATALIYGGIMVEIASTLTKQSEALANKDARSRQRHSISSFSG